MSKSYGSSPEYTPAQIRTALGRLGLDGKYAAIAYAAFLPVEAFDALHDQFSVPISYEEGRALYKRFLPANLTSAFGEPGREEHAADLSNFSGTHLQ